MRKQVCRTIRIGKHSYPAAEYTRALEMLVTRGYVRLVRWERGVKRYEVTAQGRPVLSDLVD